MLGLTPMCPQQGGAAPSIPECSLPTRPISSRTVLIQDHCPHYSLSSSASHFTPRFRSCNKGSYRLGGKARSPSQVTLALTAPF